ncbi:hypothetical protein THAOC_19329, partial [Thalassiosira oceanica]
MIDGGGLALNREGEAFVVLLPLQGRQALQVLLLVLDSRAGDPTNQTEVVPVSRVSPVFSLSSTWLWNCGSGSRGMSMAGLYFGKKGEQVNENGTNLCCAHLPGGGFRILHDQVKTLIITFLRLAGVEADEESALWMLGKVRNPYMQRYTDAILHAQAQNKTNPEGTIVADFVARDFPVPTQASNDSGLGARTDVLGEVKTLQPSKSSYDKGNCQTNRP